MELRPALRMKQDSTTRSPVVLPGFGSYLKECRERAGFRSQRAAVRALESRKVKISDGLLAHYESGRVVSPTLDLLAALATLYGADFFELTLRLARAKYELVAGSVAPGDGERWNLVEAALTPPARIGTAADLDAHQVRGRAAFLREVQVLDVEGLADWQRTIVGLETFWVIAPYFLEDENDRLLHAVAENLKRGVRYTYFTHRDRRTRFGALLEKLQAHVGSRPRVEKVARAVWIPPGALTWLHADYDVANPTVRSSSVGFQSLRHEGKTRYAFRLPDPDLLDLVDKVTAWRDTQEGRS
ncbi:MAG: helix-turn-helix domain-containing protein [Planctomycetes bacterium]|nr:helix-turn-helix domain-containing protein [Planctomycetota bacterium]